MTASGSMGQAPGPSGPEMLANIRLMRQRPPDFLAQCAQRYGPVVRFPIPRSEVLFISDPVDVRRVLQQNHKAYGKRTVQYDTLALVTGSGLLASDADLWLRMRRTLAPAFHRDLVDGMAATVRTVTERWIDERPANDHACDLDAAMLELTMQVVSETLLGGALAGDPQRLVGAVMDALHVVVAKAQTPLSSPESWPTRSNRRLRDALRVLDASVDEVIRVRRLGAPGPDALSLLIQAHAEGVASTREVRNEVVTLIVAGHETVAATLTWTWLLLAEHPAIESRVVAEAEQLPDSRPWAAADLELLPVIRAVIDEGLRLFPPAWVVTRRSLEADVLGGYRVPANTTVIMSPYVVQRDERWWPRPEQFDPERFLGRRDTDTGSGPLRYLPFGAGPRLCIGRDLALLQAPIVIAALARRLRMRPLHPERVRPDFGVTLRPSGGVVGDVSRRSE